MCSPWTHFRHDVEGIGYGGVTKPGFVRVVLTSTSLVALFHVGDAFFVRVGEKGSGFIVVTDGSSSWKSGL